MNYKEELEKIGYKTEVHRAEVIRNGRQFYRFELTMNHEDGTWHKIQRETDFYPSDNAMYFCGYIWLQQANELAIQTE